MGVLLFRQLHQNGNIPTAPQAADSGQLARPREGFIIRGEIQVAAIERSACCRIQAKAKLIPLSKSKVIALTVGNCKSVVLWYMYKTK